MYKGSGSSGGDTPRTPVESPDSLVNISYARILDLVSEGEIKGLVDGANSIFLNGTPAESGGVITFSGFTYDERVGTQSQDYISGFPQIESNISVGVELRSNTPYIRTITNSNVSSLRVNIGVPRLAQQITSGKKQGDTVGYRVVYRVDVDDGSGVFTDVGGGAFDGKTTTGYQRSVNINLPRTAGSRRIRIRRITPNSTLSTVSDATNIISVTEIIDAKLRYPNSAHYGVSFNAQTFGGQVPSRAYLLDGRIISIPTNYNPVDREYTGVWDGTFKKAFSNNPAWVFYDILTNTRYGLGNRVSGADIDKWSLYEIARYCDEPVDDGNGGIEPRYTCNCYLQSAADALKVLQDLASVFRGITYWGAGSAYARADMPRDPIYTYTNANVIDGKFVYKGSSRSTRYSVVDVGWNDPTDQYKIKVERVQHPLAFDRYGFQPTTATAFACTSQGQAIRLGRHILETNFTESNMVSFSAGLDSIHCMPGDVIRIADNDRAGRRIGGRILSSTATSVTCDKINGVSVGSTIYIAKPDGGLYEREVSAVSGNVISFEDELDVPPISMAVYSFDHPDLVAQLFRVVAISDNEDGTYSFTCAAYNPSKYDYIDSDVIIAQRQITALPLASQEPPSNLSVTSDYLIDQYQAVTKMTIAWDKAEGASKYVLEWRRDDNNWVSAGETYVTEMDVYGIYGGTYDIRVKAISPTNKHSAWETLYGQLLEGKTANVDAITNLTTTSEIFAISVKWGFPAGATDTAYTEMRIAKDSAGTNATTVLLSYPTDEYLHSGMASAVSLFFSARLIDKSGNAGAWSPWVMGQSSADADEILDYLTGQIGSGQLNQELTNEIGQIPSLVENQGVMQQGIADLFDDVDAANQELVNLSQSIGNINGDIAGIESILNQHGIDINALFNSDQDLEDQINDLQAQIADVLSAPEYDPAETYLEGIIVKFDGSLYRALQNVPLGINPTNAAYWEKIGDYDSLGEVVSSLVVRMGSAESDIDGLDGRVSANANDILALDSRVIDAEDGLEANSQAIESLETSVDIIGDQITAQSQSVSYLKSSLRDITDYNGYLEDVLNEHDSFAMIREVRTTVVTNEKSQATINLSVQTRFNENEAAFNQEVMTRSDADSSLSVRIDSLAARTSSTESAIVNEATVRANADSALASSITTIQSQVNDPATGLPAAFSAIQNEATTRANEDGALSTQINNLSVSVNDIDDRVLANAGAIDQIEVEVETIEGMIQSNASQTTFLYSQYRDRDENGYLEDVLNGHDSFAAVREVRRAFSSESKSQASINLTVSAKLNENESLINSESLARSTADEALASDITTVAAMVNDPDTGLPAAFSAIQNEATTRANEDGALATQISTVQSKVDDPATGLTAVAGAISNEATVRAAADGVLTTQITNLSASVNDPDTGLPALSTSIQTVSETVIGIDGEISATYAVKLQQNIGGVITFAGFGIGLTNETGVTQSTFLVNADQFAILNDPTGTSATSPFIVTGGQVYIRDAVIQNASISFAKIQNDIESSNYVENSQGWKIDKNGNISINGSQSGTGRMSIKNNVIEIFDNNNVRRVRLGLW